jgi:hypothetical protein
MQKPVLFLLGPSGAGKSQLGKWLAEDLGFVHVEIDRFGEGDGIDLEGLRREWDRFYHHSQPSDLARAARDRAAGAAGAVLSFPGNLVLGPNQLEAAQNEGILTFILYGSGADCLDAFLARECQTGRQLPEEHWVAHSQSPYVLFSLPKFSRYRLMMFENSVRRTKAALLEEIKERIAAMMRPGTL